MNYVNLDIQDGIGTVEFFTEQSNSLPGEILKILAATITEAGNNPDIKVIILKSGGDRTFCAGASFDELISIDQCCGRKRILYGLCECHQRHEKSSQIHSWQTTGKSSWRWNRACICC